MDFRIDKIFYIVVLQFVFVLGVYYRVSADVIIQESSKPVESMSIDYGEPSKHEFGSKKEDDTVVERESVLNTKKERTVPEKYRQKQGANDLHSELNQVEGKPLVDWYKGEKRKEKLINRDKVNESKGQGQRMGNNPRGALGGARSARGRPQAAVGNGQILQGRRVGPSAQSVSNPAASRGAGRGQVSPEPKSQNEVNRF